jgi:hypothetical protein
MRRCRRFAQIGRSIQFANERDRTHASESVSGRRSRDIREMHCMQTSQLRRHSAVLRHQLGTERFGVHDHSAISTRRHDLVGLGLLELSSISLRRAPSPGSVRISRSSRLHVQSIAGLIQIVDEGPQNRNSIQCRGDESPTRRRTGSGQAPTRPLEPLFPPGRR